MPQPSPTRKPEPSPADRDTATLENEASAAPRHYFAHEILIGLSIFFIIGGKVICQGRAGSRLLICLYACPLCQVVMAAYVKTLINDTLMLTVFWVGILVGAIFSPLASICHSQQIGGVCLLQVVC